MAVEVIDKIKPKNGGSFPIVEAIDVEVSEGQRLPEALTAKANAADVTAATTDLQSQIDQIVISASSESVVAPEVAQARVDADGVEHSTLKARIDKDTNDIRTIILDANNIERGTYSHGVKANDNLRLRTKTALTIRKGDRVAFTSDTLYYEVIIYADDISSEQQDSIKDSGWSNAPYFLSDVDGYAVILYANGATYGTSTTITVSDYDSNTCIVKDVYKVAATNQRLDYLAADTQQLQNKSYQLYKNLIPSNSTEKAPCFLPNGTEITMSTADGLALGVSNMTFLVYDKDKSQLNYWTFPSSSSKRTITLLADVYYIGWNKAVDRDLQVEIGDTATNYEPYNKNLIGSIYDIYNDIGSIENAFSRSMADYSPVIGTMYRGNLDTSNNKRISTQNYISVSGKCTITTSIGDVSLSLYNEDKTWLEDTAWSASAEVNNNNVKFVRFCMRKSSANPVIEPEEVEELASQVTIIRPLSENAFSDGGNNDSIIDDNQTFALNAIRKTASANYDTFTLLHFSDLHGRAARLNEVINFYEKNKTRYSIQDAILTGDIVYQKYSNGMDWFDAVDGSEDILLAIGNHDATEGTNDYETNEHTQAELWSRYFASRISNWSVNVTAGNTYYYKDYADCGIRLIVLDSMLSGDDLTAQNTWLEGVLSDALTNGFAIVTACHYRCNDSEKFSCNFTDYNKVLRNYTKNSFSPIAMASIQTFIENGGEFICHLCGHMHTDVISYNAEYPDQLFVSVADAYGMTGYGESDLDRAHVPDAFNLFFVDRSNHCFKLIRIGANCDTYLRERNSIVVDYRSKSVISMN